MIIGLTGTAGSGKDTVADYLKEKGFAYHSCSDILRDECKKVNQETNRNNLITMGKKLREEEGFGVLAIRLLKKIKENNEKDTVVVSIRHPDEVKALKEDPSFKMIFVDAPIELRYERIQKRVGRPEDKVTFEEFKEQEEKEMQTSGSGQQLGVVKDMSDYKIDNSGTLEELNKQVKGVFEDVEA